MNEQNRKTEATVATESATDQFNYLADLGLFTPSSDHIIPTVPSMYKRVQTVTTCGTKAL